MFQRDTPFHGDVLVLPRSGGEAMGPGMVWAFDPQAVCNLLWACATLGYVNPVRPSPPPPPHPPSRIDVGTGPPAAARGPRVGKGHLKGCYHPRPLAPKGVKGGCPDRGVLAGWATSSGGVVTTNRIPCRSPTASPPFPPQALPQTLQPLIQEHLVRYSFNCEGRASPWPPTDPLGTAVDLCGWRVFHSGSDPIDR